MTIGFDLEASEVRVRVQAFEETGAPNGRQLVDEQRPRGGGYQEGG